MPPPERFKPYSRGVSREEIIAYLEDSDERPTCRDTLSKRALQMEAANRQRILDAGRHHTQPDVAINSHQLPQEATTSAVISENLVHQEFRQSSISPALWKRVEYHAEQETKSTSSFTSESSLSDLESSPGPFEPAERRLSAAQIKLSGEEELINLDGLSSPEPFNDLIDFKQLDGFLSQFEGVDVFAPASVVSDPPTPVLPPNSSSKEAEVDNVKDSNVAERVNSTTETFEQQSHVVARLDKLINIQSQALCVNLLTFGMLVQKFSQDSDLAPLSVTKT